MTHPEGQELLERNIRRSSWASVIGLVLLVGALLLSFLQLGRLNEEVTAKTELRDSLRVEVAALQRQRDSLAVVTDTLYTALETASSTTEAREAVVRAQTAFYTQIEQQPPTVYLHVPDERSRGAVRPLRAALQEEGYDVPEVEVVAQSPQRTQVRYFSEDQERLARAVADVLARHGYAAEVNLTQSRVPAAHLEVWIGTSDRGVPVPVPERRPALEARPELQPRRQNR